MKTSLFQDHNSRYSKDLIANSSRFLEGIQENERQVELEKLSEHSCRLVVVDRSFEQCLQSVSGAQLRGGRPPLPFFENRKKSPDSGKKCPDCVHP